MRHRAYVDFLGSSHYDGSMTIAVNEMKRKLVALGFVADKLGSTEVWHRFTMKHPIYPVVFSVELHREYGVNAAVMPEDTEDYRIRHTNSKLPICLSFPHMLLDNGSAVHIANFIENYTSAFIEFK